MEPTTPTPFGQGCRCTRSPSSEGATRARSAGPAMTLFPMNSPAPPIRCRGRTPVCTPSMNLVSIDAVAFATSCVLRRAVRSQHARDLSTFHPVSASCHHPLSDARAVPPWTVDSIVLVGRFCRAGRTAPITRGCCQVRSSGGLAHRSREVPGRCSRCSEVSTSRVHGPSPSGPKLHRPRATCAYDTIDGRYLPGRDLTGLRICQCSAPR